MLTHEQTYGSLVPDAARYTPPEVVKGGWDIIKRHPLSAVDAYGLGILIYEVFNVTLREEIKLARRQISHQACTRAIGALAMRTLNFD